ncbi:MAG: polysaccharide deacetylase family protein [Candidatus Omnitrophota bacterium]|nr:polysaccharide deacetylase family protein [Candidatus Omnitrophota bacterium]
MINALGIDVEEWFHICGIKSSVIEKENHIFESRVIENTTQLLEVLKEYNVRATFFILGIIAQNFPDLVRKISEYGHEVASHSFNHFLVYRQTRDEFERDLKNSIEILSAITSKKILGFRAPDFSIVKESLWALDVLRNAGIKYDCSIFPVTHPRYGIPKAKTNIYEIRNGLIEFPPSTIRILGKNFPVAGGAYFRILPYSFIKLAIKKLNSNNLPANIYLHPWEIDYKQPRLKIPFVRSFTHYVGLKKALSKFKRLLSDFRFAPISEVLAIERD